MNIDYYTVALAEPALGAHPESELQWDFLLTWRANTGWVADLKLATASRAAVLERLEKEAQYMEAKRGLPTDARYSIA